jgi:YtkA-like
MPRMLRDGLLIIGASFVCLAGSATAADVRASADVTCRPASEKLQYDCTIKLTNARTGAPLTGVALTIGADMPSMPMMHNVRPVKATPGPEAGVYQARVVLEMHGDWALQLNVSGSVRDRVIKTMRFQADGATPQSTPDTPTGHRH